VGAKAQKFEGGYITRKHLLTCLPCTITIQSQHGSGPVVGGEGEGLQRRKKMEEKKVGEVIKFFGKISVAAIRLSEG
jgi:hypothetical protein